MSIKSIIRWFEIAKPQPTSMDVAVQVGCHYEEVSEMLEATNNYGDLSDLADFYKDGFGNDNVVNFDRLALLDALCDQVVTAIGVGVLMGFDMAAAIKEVDRSNWTKFAKDQDGKYVPYIRPDGKIGKNPETYQEPQLADYVSLTDRQQRAKDNLLAILEQAESNTPAPYTSKKITVERIVTEVGENNDPINPNHYKSASGVECIDVAELFPYALGNAIKYAWRAGKKDNLKQDLEKCEWYLNRADENGDTVFYRLESRELTKAVALFCKLSKDDFIDERNHLLVSAIVHGNTEKALNKIDDWLKDL